MSKISSNTKLLLRRFLRHAVALFIWLNAIFATRFINLHAPALKISASIATDITVMSFILFYGVICDFGWMSVWFDALYIYLWPFVLVFKALFSGAKYLWRRYHVQSDGSTSASSDQTKSVATESVTSQNVFIRVFGRFALLWAVIAVNTEIKVLAIIGILAALFGALRASYNLWDFISDAIDWIGSLEGPFSKRLAEAIRALRESNQPEHAQKIKNAANLLRMAEKVCNFLADQKRILAKATRIIAFFITIPLYIYISSIFAAVYFGIAKLEHLTLDWRSALIDSLFVPIAFTDLPHSFAIRLIAGIHAVVIGAIGYNVLFRHFNSKITQLSATALELGRPFQDRELMTQIDLYADKIDLKPKAVASESAPIRQDQGVA